MVQDAVRIREWLLAAEHADMATLARLLGAGMDIEAADAGGRTALFYAVAPAGGTPAVVEWLVRRGADTVIEYGALHVAAGCEHSTLRECAAILEEGAPPAFRSIDQAMGRWRIVGGPDDGRVVTVDGRWVGGDLRSLFLKVDEVALDLEGRVTLSGDHAGLLVSVTLTLRADARVDLTWQDGVTFDAEYLLRR